MELARDDLIDLRMKPRVPCRVVLNNRTISVFEADHYDAVKFSAPLNTINLYPWAEDTKVCFVVEDARTSAHVVLCAL
jgi:hypothetical protein